MTISTIILILITHYVADFLLQTESMALNKSHSNLALGKHVLVYTVMLALSGHFVWSVLNGVLHFVTDYTTSRMTALAWAQKRRGKFFNIIGADQLIHTSLLIATWGLV